MRLIVNADDFGYSKGVNEDIIYCHRYGIVTSTTILAGGPAFDHAVDMSKQNPKLKIGVHLAIDGPLNIGQDYRSLLDPNSGGFHNTSEIVKKIRNKELEHEELVKEYSLQVEKVQSAGINITHLDHHHHLHLYFPILKAVIEVAKKYQIPFIRSQRLLLSLKRNYLKDIYRRYHQYYLSNRHDTTVGYVCLLGNSQNEMKQKLRKIISSTRGVLELVVHPSQDNGELEFLTKESVLQMTDGYLMNFAGLLTRDISEEISELNILK